VAELPFTLMHPKPEEQYFDRPSSSSGSHKSESLAPQSSGSAAAAVTVGGKENGDGGVLIDTNLIQLDTVATACYAEQEDDIIFEDFARLRLKGETEA